MPTMFNNTKWECRRDIDRIFKIIELHNTEQNKLFRGRGKIYLIQFITENNNLLII